jgi:hypothetical protein
VACAVFITDEDGRGDLVANTFLVPVRAREDGTLALKTGRLRTGERVGLAFTTEDSLLLTMGRSEQWVRLDGDALREMLVPLGVRHVRIDPQAASSVAET